MGNKTLLGAALATAAAVAFSTSASATSPNMLEGIPSRVKCEGINACRGQSACNTIANGCQGQNACKGHGWLYIDGQSLEEATKQCKTQGGTVTY
jgi:hypothetical protein